MQKRYKKILTIILSIALSIILLYLSFEHIDWNKYVAALKSCTFPTLALSAVAGALMPLCRSLRWRTIVLPFEPHLKHSDSILANYVGYLTNMAIPFTHEPTRCIIIHKLYQNSISYDTLTGTAILERVIDAICIAVLFLISIIISKGRFLPFLVSCNPANDSGLILNTAALMIISSVIITLATLFFLIKNNKNANVSCGKIWRFLSGIAAVFKSILRLKKPVSFILETILLWFIYWLQMYLGTSSVPAMNDIGAVDCMFLLLASIISTLVPAPAGLGAYHFMVASVLFSIYHVPWSEGIAFATLVHESQMLLLLLSGLISSLILRVSDIKTSL